MGPTCPFTYFLVVNGCPMRFATLGSAPFQKSPVEAGWVLQIVRVVPDARGCVVELELPCCAIAGSTIVVDNRSVTKIWLFISTSCPGKMPEPETVNFRGTP